MVRMPLWGFLRESIPCSMFPLVGAAAWLGAGGEVGASDGMVATPLSFKGRVLRHPRNYIGDEGAVVPLCVQRIRVGLLEGGPGFKVGSHCTRGDTLSPLCCPSWEGFSVIPGMIRRGQRSHSSLYARRETGGAPRGTFLRQPPSVVRKGTLRRLLRNYPPGGLQETQWTGGQDGTRRGDPSSLRNYQS